MSEAFTPKNWLAERMRHIESSGIRKVFELARSLKDPVNLSIGQPDFDVPEPIKQAARDAIDRGDNGYTVTQGIAELRAKLTTQMKARYSHPDREVFVTSGTSGGLLLALCCVVNPGDEVVIFDPYFVMYPHLVTLAGGKSVYVDTYPTFDIDIDRLRSVLTPRTKVILLNSPGNPSGRVLPADQLRAVAELARERGILLISDEVYRCFCYEGEFVSPADFNDQVLVVDGFSKAYGMTGWRLGFAHGPKVLIDEMIKLQQFSFVCAPSIVQHAGVAALDFDVSGIVADYRQKRDRIYNGVKDLYELAKPEGAFYLFMKAPWGTGSSFVAEAIRRNLLIIPGNIFSQHDSHFRLSYAASDETIDRGIEILRGLASASE